jgi:cytochrome c biogenesis protein CcmG, thiol:disulfide interchange protein DsbE
LVWLRRALPWIAFAMFCWWGVGGMAPSGAFPVGAELPHINTQLTDGSRFSLQQVSGQILVLNFWASYCEPCRREAPFLTEAQAPDVRVVGLTVEPFSDADASRFASQIGMNYPVGVADEALLSRFRVQSVPTTYVIDKHGKIVLSRVGAIAKRELDAAIAEARNAT